MSGLYADTRSTRLLEPTVRQQMYAIYQSYYASTTLARFKADLANKTHTMLLLDDSDTIRGFTSLALYTQTLGDAPAQIVFSGDTIVERDYWGQQTLPMAWIELTGQFKAQQPTLPLYWFLIVKGYRTYRYLSVFSRNYYPHPSEPTPTDVQQRLDQLASERFGSAYNNKSGCIVFPKSRGHLSGDYATVPERLLSRPEVECFLRLNPDYHQGSELACITELSVDNLSRRACVYFERGLQRC